MVPAVVHRTKQRANNQRLPFRVRINSLGDVGVKQRESLKKLPDSGRESVGVGSLQRHGGRLRGHGGGLKEETSSSAASGKLLLRVSLGTFKAPSPSAHEGSCTPSRCKKC